MQYIKNVLRLAFMEDDIKLESIKDTMTYSIVMNYWKDKYSSFEYEDFVFFVLGYSNDSNYSPKQRYDFRKIITLNRDNKKFWNELKVKHNVDSIEQVVDYLSFLDVLGVGRTPAKVTKKWEFTGKPSYMKNKELLNVFCSAVPVVNTKIVSNTEVLTLETLVKLFNMSTYSNFKKLAKTTSVDFESLFDVKVGNSYRVSDGEIMVKGDCTIHDKKDFIMNLVYLASIKADKINQQFLDLYLTSMSKGINLFNMSDEDFKNMVDVSHMMGIKLKSMYHLLGIKVPSLSFMISSSYGIFFRLNNDICYIPESLGCESGMPAQIDMSDFSSFINNEQHLNITYINRIPYIGNNVICSGGTLSESRNF